VTSHLHDWSSWAVSQTVSVTGYRSSTSVVRHKTVTTRQTQYFPSWTWKYFNVWWKVFIEHLIIEIHTYKCRQLPTCHRSQQHQLPKPSLSLSFCFAVVLMCCAEGLLCNLLLPISIYCQKSEVWEAITSCVYVLNTFYVWSAYVPVDVWFGWLVVWYHFQAVHRMSLCNVWGPRWHRG